jgi:hypothetical protein
MPTTARNPIRVAAAALVTVGLLAAVGLPAGSSAAASSPAPAHTHRAQPADAILPGLQVAGQANTAVAVAPAVLTNWVTVSGDDGEDGNGSTFLLGPVQPAPGATGCAGISADQWANAPGPELFTYSIDGSVRGGNGSHWLSSVQMSRPGCYGWAHHIALTPSGATADSSPATTGETTLIVQPQPTASINTAWATEGSYLTDTLTLAGTYGRPVQITGQLLQAPVSRAGRTPSCTGVAGQWDNPTTVASIGPFTVTGDGEHPVPGQYQATSTACYSFTYQVTVTVDANTTATASVPAGAAGNTTLTDTPSITTTASSDQTGAGAANLSDALTVTGLHLQPGDHASVTAQVLTAPAGANGCADVDWANAAQTSSPTSLAIPADGLYSTPPVAVQAGCHTFTETLSVNGHHVSTTAEQPGQPAETLLIAPATPTPPPTASSSAPSEPPTPSVSSSAIATSTATPTGQGPTSTAAPAVHPDQTRAPVPAVSGTRQLASTGVRIQAAATLAILLLLAGAALVAANRRHPHQRAK